MEELLKFFVFACTPLYFILGRLITKYDILSNHQEENETEIGNLTKVFIVIMSVATLIGAAYSFVGFYRICRELLLNSFEKISIGGLYSARGVLFKICVCSFNMNVIWQIIRGNSRIDQKVCDTTEAGFKWMATHIMNFISVMALYYSIYKKNSGAGNTFLIGLASFTALEWLIRDIFNKISLLLKIDPNCWLKYIDAVKKPRDGD